MQHNNLTTQDMFQSIQYCQLSLYMDVIWTKHNKSNLHVVLFNFHVWPAIYQRHLLMEGVLHNLFVMLTLSWFFSMSWSTNTQLSSAAVFVWNRLSKKFMVVIMTLLTDTSHLWHVWWLIFLSTSLCVFTLLFWIILQNKFESVLYNQ